MLGLPELCAGAALLGMIAYAIFGGADFGGGVWDLLASGPRRDDQRKAVARAMGPVWEANHVWLIFVIVIFFSAFPRAFAAYSIALFAPLRLVLVGITLRGVAFVFRAYAPHHGRGTSRWGIVFGASSIVTPILLGMCVGAVSDGGLRVDDNLGVRFEGRAPWYDWLSLAMGLGASSLCAYLAAVFLCVETRGELQEDFRRRALLAGTVVVAGASLTIPLTYFQAPHLWQGLTSLRAAPVIAVGACASVASGLALLRRWFRIARLATTIQVSLLLVGWALAQHPYLIYPDVTIKAAAAPDATLKFVLGSLPFGLALIVPSLWYLIRVFKGDAARLT